MLLFLLLMLMLELGLEVYGYLASDAGAFNFSYFVLAFAGYGVCWLALSLWPCLVPPSFCAMR